MPEGAGDGSGPPLTAEELARGIAAGELIVVYQPRIALPAWRITDAEALVRWRHPGRGEIAPGAFIPLAEETGLIIELTRVVTGEALRQCRRWREAGLEIGVAVNASARDVSEIDFPDRLEALCAAAEVPPGVVTIELTETAAMHNAVEMLDSLTRLRLKGFRLAIDDFGTGYSSLAQLQRLPFSELKIDRSFVMEADWSRDARVIIKAVINLAHNLGLAAVAEGVETQGALDFLIELGCDAAQGYHIARPMTGAALLDSAVAGAA